MLLAGRWQFSRTKEKNIYIDGIYSRALSMLDAFDSINYNKNYNLSQHSKERDGWTGEGWVTLSGVLQRALIGTLF